MLGVEKEHLNLGEVGTMLKVINEEKRDMDRSKGKRVHDASWQQDTGGELRATQKGGAGWVCCRV